MSARSNGSSVSLPTRASASVKASALVHSVASSAATTVARAGMSRCSASSAEGSREATISRAARAAGGRGGGGWGGGRPAGAARGGGGGGGGGGTAGGGGRGGPGGGGGGGTAPPPTPGGGARPRPAPPRRFREGHQGDGRPAGDGDLH